jgi:hypothetical protein
MTKCPQSCGFVTIFERLFPGFVVAAVVVLLLTCMSECTAAVLNWGGLALAVMSLFTFAAFPDSLAPCLILTMEQNRDFEQRKVQHSDCMQGLDTFDPFAYLSESVNR